MGGVPQQAPATSRPQGPQQAQLAQQALLGPGSTPTGCSLGAPAGRSPAGRGGSREAAPRRGAAGGGWPPRVECHRKAMAPPRPRLRPQGWGAPQGGGPLRGEGGPVGVCPPGGKAAPEGCAQGGVPPKGRWCRPGGRRRLGGRVQSRGGCQGPGCPSVQIFPRGEDAWGKKGLGQAALNFSK